MPSSRSPGRGLGVALLIGSLGSAAAARAAPSFEPSEGRGGRIAVEGAGYLGATALGVVTGATVACGLDQWLSEHSERMFGCLGPAVLGGLGTAAAVAPLGAWGGGRLMGGNGTLGWTYVGHAGGLLGGAALAFVLTEGLDAPGWVSALGVLLLPATGAVLGFELSSHPVPESTASTAAPLLGAPSLSYSGSF